MVVAPVVVGYTTLRRFKHPSDVFPCLRTHRFARAPSTRCPCDGTSDQGSPWHPAFYPSVRGLYCYYCRCRRVDGPVRGVRLRSVGNGADR